MARIVDQLLVELGHLLGFETQFHQSLPQFDACSGAIGISG
jgi:hypothetical protein